MGIAAFNGTWRTSIARCYSIVFPGSFGSWYATYFLRGFCYYWPLLVLFLLPLGMLVGVGAKYGPKYLFFHDHKPKQFAAGVGVALFSAAILFVSYLLFLRDRRATKGSRAARHSPQRFLPYALALIVCLGVTTLGAIAVYSACKASFRVLADTDAQSSTFETAPIFVLGALATWGIMVLIGLVGFVVEVTRPKSVGAPRWSGLGWIKYWRVPLWYRLRRIGRPPTSGKEVAARSVLRLVLGVPLGVVWVVVLVQVLRGPVWEDVTRYAVSVAFAVAGLVLTGLSAVYPRQSRLLLGALSGNAVLLYAGVSFCLSSCPWGAIAAFVAALGGVIYLGAVVWTFFPVLWQRAEAAVLRRVLALPRREGNALLIGLVGLFFIPGILAGLGLVPNFASPVPFILLVLFGVGAVYGLVAYAIRRSMPVLLAFVVLVACVSHIQQYRMRFPAFEAERIIDLSTETKQDVDRQKGFDSKLHDYQRNRDEIESTAPDAAGGNPDAHQRLQGQKADLEADLRRLWRAIEDSNKTRAGQLIEPDPSKPLLADLGLQHGRTNGDGLLVARVDHEDRNRDDDLKVWPTLPDGNRPLVVIAVSGGGIRAAVWTFAVLKELELFFARQNPPVDFPSHVRIITGASGGILGASYYVASLPPPNKRPAPNQRQIDLNQQQEWLGSDFLTPLLKRSVLSDIPGWLSPWPMRHDRGRALEQAWSDYLKIPGSADSGRGPGALDVSFECLREGEKAGWRPSLVISPMMIEDGRRLIISNLDMRYAISNDGTVLTENGRTPGFQNHSIEAMELFRLFPDVRGKFKLATAARMSASFPYFSPAVSLPTVPRRRVVDAGYYDNYGVSLAASWLFSGANEAWIHKHFKRILLIQIRDSITEDRRQLREQEPDGSSFWRRAIEELTSPPEGLYNASTSSSSFRNDGQLELLDKFEHLRRNVQRPANWKNSPILVVNLELGERVSLSWYLSEQERDKIEKKAAELVDLQPEGKGWKLLQLQSWWFWPQESP